MGPQFNHTIAMATDPAASSKFLADVLDLDPPHAWGPFHEVRLTNGVAIAFMDAGGHPISTLHYAFLVSEAEFDEIFERLQERGLQHWADPHKQRPGEINRDDGGRGVYWDDPDGHLLEMITVPYGGWPS
jgi:catechol 2,3-dioxygenase-like lactoylglutathione lyase family enzyme